MSEEKINSLDKLLSLFSKQDVEIASEKETEKNEVVVNDKSIDNTPSPEILVFKTSLLDSLGKFQGLLKGEDCELYVNEILQPENFEWIPRNLAEKDPSYKQIIPYCVIVCANKTFTYSRNKNGNENRLHGKKSLGVGGHIEKEDSINSENFYENAVKRELKEEISLDLGAIKSNKIIGIINDDSNDVGKVHFGIVHKITVSTTHCIEQIENKLSEAGWEFTGFLNKGIDQWENWSFFVISELLSELKKK